MMNLKLIVLLLLGTVVTTHGDDWPQWRGPKRDGVWRESGIVGKLPATPMYIFRAKIGAGYSGPTVVGNRVYVTDRLLEKNASLPDNQFARTPVGGVERVLCLDGTTGNELWKHVYPCRYTISYPAGPRSAPTVDGGKLYTLGAMGDLFCFDAESGKIIWSKQCVKDFGARINTWGMSAAPLIDGDNLILLMGGSKNAGVVALNKNTGAEVWRSLEFDDPGYCPPEIFTIDNVRQLIIWSPMAVHSLDPTTGKLLWEQPFPLQSALAISSPILTGNRLFVTAFYNGPLMLEISGNPPKATVVWKGKSNKELPNQTDGLHSIMSTPVIADGHIFGVCSYGALRCLDAKTGKRIWETHQATSKERWSNAFFVQHEDRYFLSNEAGDLIIAKLSPKGYDEVSRFNMLKPTNRAQRRKVVWSHPAFANQSVYARNDEELVRIDLKK